MLCVCVFCIHPQPVFTFYRHPLNTESVYVTFIFSIPKASDALQWSKYCIWGWYFSHKISRQLQCCYEKQYYYCLFLLFFVVCCYFQSCSIFYEHYSFKRQKLIIFEWNEKSSFFSSLFSVVVAEFCCIISYSVFFTSMKTTTTQHTHTHTMSNIIIVLCVNKIVVI